MNFKQRLHFIGTHFFLLMSALSILTTFFLAARYGTLRSEYLNAAPAVGKYFAGAVNSSNELAWRQLLLERVNTKADDKLEWLFYDRSLINHFHQEVLQAFEEELSRRSNCLSKVDNLESTKAKK